MRSFFFVSALLLLLFVLITALLLPSPATLDVSFESDVVEFQTDSALGHPLVFNPTNAVICGEVDPRAPVTSPASACGSRFDFATTSSAQVRIPPGTKTVLRRQNIHELELSFDVADSAHPIRVVSAGKESTTKSAYIHIPKAFFDSGNVVALGAVVSMIRVGSSGRTFGQMNGLLLLNATLTPIVHSALDRSIVRGDVVKLDMGDVIDYLAPNDAGTPTGSPADAGTTGSPADDGALDAGAADKSAEATPAGVLEKLLTVIPSWDLKPFVSRLDAGVELPAMVVQLVEQMSKTMLPLPLPAKPASENPADAADAKYYTTSASLFADWPLHPFMGHPGADLDSDGHVLDLQFGAQFTAQAHLFVADQLLRVAIDDFGVPRSRGKAARGDDSAAAGPFARPSGPATARTGLSRAFNVNSGSYWWNGRLPPHITHRDGASCDLIFGPHTVCWLKQDVSKELRKVLNEVIGKAKHLTDPEMMCRSWSQVDAKEGAPIVFRGLVSALIAEELAKLRPLAGRDPGSADGSAFAQFEKRLAGTPHFFSASVAQAVTAGHIAVQLSAPTQIIFSSPITHVRSMRAIRQGFRDAGLKADGSIWKLMAVAYGDTSFVFKPVDHHSHWHVQYAVPKMAPTDPAPMLARFESFVPLYGALGVSFEPFSDYLAGVTLGGTMDHAYAKRMTVDRDGLLKLLKTYRPNPAGRDLVRKIYLQLAPSAAERLIAPANTSKLSPQLQSLVDQSDEVISRAVRRLGVRTLGAVVGEITDGTLKEWLGNLLKEFE
jgi:hypothetical protein